MRVHETAGLFPESVLLLQAVIADLHSFGRLVDTFAVLEKRNHQFAKGEFTGMELGLFPGLDGMKKKADTISFTQESQSVRKILINWY